MRYKSITYVLLISIFFITFSSCEKENDVILGDDMKSTKVSSEQVRSIFYSESFIDISGGLEQPTLTDTTYLELNDSTFFMDKLSKATLNFQFENSSEELYKVEIRFVNDLDEVKFKLTIPLSSGSIKKPTTVETNVVIESSELETFKEATKMVYNVTLVSDTKKESSINSGLIDLKSSAIYSFGL